MPVIRRVQTKEELQLCLDVRRAVFGGEQNVRPEVDIDEYDDVDRGSECVHFLLLSADVAPPSQEDVLGTGRVKLDRFDSTRAVGQRIAIKPGMRSKGLGRVVMLALEEYARSRGATLFSVGAQVQARGFYEKIGYDIVSERVYVVNDIEHVDMVKNL
eukprot:Rmarinus@m.28120